MSEPRTLAVVQRILAEVTEEPAQPADSPLRIDSLQGLRVLVELEKHFEVEIDEEEMLEEGWFATAGSMATYLDRLVGSAALAREG